jgi:DNA-binding transcriptional LysR family regulator
MKSIHSPGMDLNLLLIFRSVYVHRSVSKAAGELGLSQSAVSHSLKKIRLLFSDELFIRAGLNMTPTPKADDLYSPIDEVLRTIDRDILSGVHFSPAQAKREFCMGMADLAEVILLPRLNSYLNVHAPSCTLRSKHLSNEDVFSALDAGTIDLAFGCFPEAEGHYYKKHIFEHGFCALSWAGSGIPEGGLSVDDYFSHRHVVVDSGPDQYFNKVTLAPLNRTRDNCLKVSGYLSVPWLLQGTDYLATIPSGLAKLLVPVAPVQLHQLEWVSDSFKLEAIWNARLHHDPGHKWIRKVVYDLLEDLRSQSSLKFDN